jgi:PAS domain S-box-containing protein
MVIQDRGESAALATEAQFRLFADTIPVLAWYAEPDGNIPWYNQRWFEFTGTTLESQAGRGWQAVHDPADLDRIVAGWQAALRSGEPWEDQFRLRRRDGQFRWFLARAVPLRDASGRIVRWFGTNVDIDDQKRAGEQQQRSAQAELRASEERFHHLVDAISDYAICMLDATGHVATWNQGAEKIKGYRPEAIIGQHFSVFYTPEDRAAGKPEKVLDTVRREGRFEEENWRVRRDGTRFWASVVITALQDPTGAVTGFAKVTRDLTAKRAADEQREALIREQLAHAESERARAELDRLNRTKDEFLATMSHELRTPLNAIYGWASLLRRQPRPEERLERGLEVIERNARAQTKLIDDLLDMSRIVTGKLHLSLARTDLYPLLVAASDVVKPAAEAKGVRLVIDIDPAIGAMMADPDRLQQILWNLLTNAIRFTPRGGRVIVTADRTRSAIVLRVHDTGVGIATEHLPRLFERFMQVDSSTTRTHGGLGLGLSIVRHLAEAHGGSVEAESGGLGQGATFTVTLPIRAVGEAHRDEPPPQAEGQRTESEGATVPSLANLDGVRILVVEDEPDSLEIVCAVLERAGAAVTGVPSAFEALKALEGAGPFDVVVSDIGMPEMDGYTLIRQIRARGADAHLPAIALTAYARAEDAERARLAGFQAHLAKPVDGGRLVSVVQAWSRRSPPPRVDPP